MIKLLFPTFVLTKQYLDRDKCSEITPEYMVALKEEIDAMRKRDPKGRNISNRNGWQSVDGIDKNPVFIRALRQILSLIHI